MTAPAHVETITSSHDLQGGIGASSSSTRLSSKAQLASPGRGQAGVTGLLGTDKLAGTRLTQRGPRLLVVGAEGVRVDGCVGNVHSPAGAFVRKPHSKRGVNHEDVAS